MPHPDVIVSSQPFWFRDGWITTWIRHISPRSSSQTDKMPSKKTQDAPETIGKLARDFTAKLSELEQTNLEDLAQSFSHLCSDGARFDIAADRFLDFADRLAQAGMFSAFEFDEETLNSKTSIAALAQGLRGVRATRCGPIENAVADLSDAIRSPLLSPEARSFFRLHKTMTEEELGLTEFAKINYEILAAEDTLYAKQACYWRSYLAYGSEGRFREVLQTLCMIPASTGSCLDIRKFLLQGDVYRVNARFDEAEKAYTQALHYAKQSEARGLEGRALTQLAETLCWIRPQAGRHIAHKAIERTRQDGNKIDEFRAHTALAIANTGTKPALVVEQSLQTAERLCKASGTRTGQGRLLTGLVFHAAHTKDRKMLTANLAQSERMANALGDTDFWGDIFRTWADTTRGSISSSQAEPQWLDSREHTMQRWRQVLHTRQNYRAD